MRNLLYQLARLLGDINALTSGKVGNRLFNRSVGRMFGKSLGKWRF